ncbi:hypothetical protein IFR04_015403 [Cadophora malorum]|uniref:FMN-dependent dehydrogenase domain-containing protein n=1 Tax=Cadophora malorum TaxID=108018 RepID=A0A8H7W5C8_9HELO|nr:hypothetical protein IFR04_015403 [Cadophora malorum]
MPVPAKQKRRTAQHSGNVQSSLRDWFNTGYPALSTTVLGQKLSYLIAIALIGAQIISNTGGEIAVATAAAELNIPFTLSSATWTSFKDVSKANPSASQKWAETAGFTAHFVTSDPYAMGWRYIYMDNDYNPFLVADHVGVELGVTDPFGKNSAPNMVSMSRTISGKQQRNGQVFTRLAHHILGKT